MGVVELSGYYLILLSCAELIDIDHLFSRPIYKRKRNPFKVHIFHKNWKIILVLAGILVFIKPVFLLGLAIELHLFTDYLYVKFNKI